MSTLSPQDVLRTVFGFQHFRGEQETIVNHLIGGGDALVLMPTGGGTSLRKLIQNSKSHESFLKNAAGLYICTCTG